MIKDKAILIKNIYYMLSYAFTPLTQGGYENVEREEFENIHNLFAAMIQWSRVRFQRNNNPYRMLIGICQLILEGMLLTTDKGEYRLATFIKPELMSKLYEKFILEYYNQEHDELDASASQIPWGLDDGVDSMLPVMQTDITLTQGEKTLIIDAKYYSSTLQQHYDRMTIYSNNLYQIFTYVKNKEVELKDKPHEISRMLLYAKTDEETYPDNDYKMSGNKIGVHTLDLNVEFPQIREQLDGFVDRYFAYAKAINEAVSSEKSGR